MTVLQAHDFVIFSLPQSVCGIYTTCERGTMRFKFRDHVFSQSNFSIKFVEV